VQAEHAIAAVVSFWWCEQGAHELHEAKAASVGVSGVGLDGSSSCFVHARCRLPQPHGEAFVLHCWMLHHWLVRLLRCSEEPTELEKSAEQWGKKHRPKKVMGKGDQFKPKQNVRKGRGRKR
jgi:hypothetical protein